MSMQDRVMGAGLKVLNRFAGSTVVDKLGLRRPSEALLYQSTRAGFSTIATAAKLFGAAGKLLKPARLSSRSAGELFDLNPSEEQQMLREAVAQFADEQLRAAAQQADSACATPPELLQAAAELGITLMSLPEELGGAGQERSAVTNVLVAEALAHGDLGLAVAILAPAAVANALVLWGDVEQQSRYLPAFAGAQAPAAALAIQEPHALFDPFQLHTTARLDRDGGWLLDGLKSLVPRAAECALFLVAAHIEEDGRTGLFLVEAGSKGLSVTAEPAMGLRAAATGQLKLRGVKVPAGALLAGGDVTVYGDCIALARLGWCALASGCAQAVLDYLIPYVNGRVAFGEPISHRQAVAFTVANIAIEREGLRLLTLHAASRAERGDSFIQETALARRLAADKGAQIGSEAVQMLGGHGFTKEYPVERWYRDLRAAGIMEGVLLV
ncbi:MAG: acyl-CoA dehydrogenase family protein [Stagnimonas sp.]|nr:acyl-CoA dehydrogenase family protein [Stagnimonas sp.]